MHVARFRPMCLTARISLRRPTSHITPRTGPTRFYAWSSRGGRPEWTLGEHPHALGRRVVPRRSTQGALRAVPIYPPPNLQLRGRCSVWTVGRGRTLGGPIQPPPEFYTSYRHVGPKRGPNAARNVSLYAGALPLASESARV